MRKPNPGAQVLHVACAADAVSEALFVSLAERRPELLEATDSKGRRPLDVCRDAGSRARLLRALEEAEGADEGDLEEIQLMSRLSVGDEAPARVEGEEGGGGEAAGSGAGEEIAESGIEWSMQPRRRTDGAAAASP